MLASPSSLARPTALVAVGAALPRLHTALARLVAMAAAPPARVQAGGVGL
jgi:hypothetical protein